MNLARRKDKREWKRRNRPKTMIGEARMRARAKGLPFNIDLSDIHIPETCPVLGIPLSLGTGRHVPSSPSLDRLIPELGYTKGNVNVISMRANMVKHNSTFEELEKVYKWVKKMTKSSNKSSSASPKKQRKS
jgi:hypothetical protein